MELRVGPIVWPRILLFTSLLSYLSPLKCLFHLFPFIWVQGVDFSWNENERNLQAFIKVAETNPVVFVCPCNAENREYNLDRYPKINEYLLHKGYTKILHEYYAVYYPTNVILNKP